MSRKLKIGMIGAGFIGQLAHLMNYAEIADCKIVALAECRPELLHKVAGRHFIEKRYSRHQELLLDSMVEAVVVVTPRAYTGPIVLDCLNAKKHVLSEKPMSNTLKHGEQLVSAAKANNTKYIVGYMKRYDEGVQAAKQLLDNFIENDELGELLFVRAHCYMGNSYCNADGHIVTSETTVYSDAGWPIAPDWIPFEWRSKYAAYVNTFSHITNLLRYLFDQTPNIEYVRLTKNEAQLAVLGFHNFTCTLETGCSNNRGWDEVIEIFFKDGCISIYMPPALLRNVPAKVKIYKGSKTQEIVSPQYNWTWSFRRQAQAFVSHVLDDTLSLNPASDALEDLKLIEAMWQMELGVNSSNA